MREELLRLIAAAAADSDVVLRGSGVHGLLDGAVPLLADVAVCVPVRAMAELNLSGLIAQIAVDDDLQGQDDAVLERAFKRLTVTGHTVLVLDLPAGLSRAAAQFVQHVVSVAPGLRLVVHGSAPLDAMLADPGLKALSARLEAAVALAVPMQSEPARVALLRESSRGVVPTRRARAARWCGSAAAAAAVVAAMLWMAHAALHAGLEDAPDARPKEAVRAVPPIALAAPAPPTPGEARPLEAEAPVPPSSVVVVAPTPAAPATEPTLAAEAPAPDVPATPALAGAVEPMPTAPAPAVTATTTPDTPAPTVAAALPPIPIAPGPVATGPVAPSPVAPAPVATAALPPLRPAPATRRPELAHLQRPHRPWVPSRGSDAARYYPYEPDEPPPPEPAWERSTRAYLGTFAVDPYGVRTFRYEP